MRFVLIQEADGPGDTAGTSTRYHEMIKEAQAAEDVGFSSYAISEQHFNKSVATIPAPDTFLAAVAMRTSSIRLRVASFVLLPFNHPLRIAERIATLDLLSGGRVDVGTARSNSPDTLQAFGVSPDMTRAYWEESFQIVRGALTTEDFSYQGEFWQIPPVTVYPRPLQKPSPPLHVSATSLETHLRAGQLGIGMMTGNSLPGGWDYLEEAIATYERGLAESFDSPDAAHTVCRGALSVVTYCADSTAQAHRDAKDAADRFVGMVADWYEQLSKSSSGYAAMGPLKEIVERRHDLAHLIDRSPYLSIGTPDFFLERCEVLRQLGYEEFIVRIDGMTHEQHLQTIKMFGEHVIPHVSTE